MCLPIRDKLVFFFIFIGEFLSKNSTSTYLVFFAGWHLQIMWITKLLLFSLFTSLKWQKTTYRYDRREAKEIKKTKKRENNSEVLKHDRLNWQNQQKNFNWIRAVIKFWSTCSLDLDTHLAKVSTAVGKFTPNMKDPTNIHYST